MIECIVNSNRPINASISSFLHRKASEMIYEKKKSLRLRGKVCRGLMTTEGKYGNLGSISGLLFTADIDDGNHEMHLTFIVRRPNLKSRADDWVYAPMPAIEQLVALDEQEENPGYYGPN